MAQLYTEHVATSEQTLCTAIDSPISAARALHKALLERYNTDYQQGALHACYISPLRPHAGQRRKNIVQSVALARLSLCRHKI